MYRATTLSLIKLSEIAAHLCVRVAFRVPYFSHAGASGDSGPWKRIHDDRAIVKLNLYNGPRLR